MKSIELELRADITEVISGLNVLSQNLDLLIESASVAASSLQNGGTIFFCGNGGSAADSQHWAAELTGKFNFERASYRAIALTVDTSALTAIGNDFGFDQVFARQIEGLAKPKDVLVGISTSGNSRNVLEAFKKMQSIGGTTVAFSGPNEGKLNMYSDFLINCHAPRTDLIQDIQVVVGHSFCKIVEQKMIETQAK